MKIYKRQLIFFTIWLLIGIVLNELGINVYENEYYRNCSFGLFAGYLINLIVFIIFEYRDKVKKLEVCKGFLGNNKTPKEIRDIMLKSYDLTEKDIKDDTNS